MMELHSLNRSPEALHVGVDGCAAGWFAVTERLGKIEFGVFGAMHELLTAHSRAQLILVDIPIGLPSSTCNARPCDAAARKELGAPRASSVFPAPGRTAIEALNFAAAQAANKAELGRSLSKQTFAICPKIAEVDHLLSFGALARSVVREMHPEICFWSLNGRRAMRHAKRSPAGISERTDVLGRHEPRAAELLAAARSLPRKLVKADDVLDALAGFVTARAGLASLEHLWGTPSHDDKGLPMEMLFLDPGRKN